MRLRLTTRQADILLNLLRPDFLSAKWPGSVRMQGCSKNSAMAAKFNGGWKPFPNAVLFGDFIYGASDWLVPMRPNAPPQFNTFYKFVCPFLIYYKMKAKTEEWWSAPSGCGRIVSRASRLAFVSRIHYCCQLIKACGYLHNFLLNVRTEREIDDEEFMGQLQDLNEEEAEQHTVNG
uniref:DDE Tnp4 domain-containing protein n=1 Tax=Ditylenchus dipsaci TaxID=166011 RepID=A0A915ECY6_9BILA